MNVKYAVRPMELGDIPQVGEIDKESFPTMWPPVAYKRELTQNRLARYIVADEVGAEVMPDTEAIPSTGNNGARSGLAGLVSGLKTLFGGKADRVAEPPSPRQKLVGLAGLWFMVDEAHLTTIAVRGSYRRQGIGELLLISAIDLSLERQCRFVTLEVRVSNKGAQAFYEKYGLARTGMRKGYYTDNHEDALIMSTDAISSDQYQALFRRLKEDYSRKHGGVPSAQPR